MGGPEGGEDLLKLGQYHIKCSDNDDDDDDSYDGIGDDNDEYDLL